MPIELIAILESGAYRTPEEALDSAIANLESTVDHDFEGSIDELNQLIVEGLNSGPSIEVNDDFWRQLDAKTDKLLLEHQGQKIVS
jgi:hypothetical protein